MTAKLKNALANVVFGTSSIFVRAVPLGSAEIAFFRSFIASVFLMVCRAAKHEPLMSAHIKKRLPLLFLTGAGIGAEWVLVFEAYRYTTVSIATLTYYFAPVLITALCPLLFHERLTLRQGVCFFFATVGLVLVTKIDKNAPEGTSYGILLSLAAALLYAFIVITNKFITDVAGVDRTLYQFIAASVVILPYVLFNGGFGFFRAGIPAFLCLMTLGVLHSGVCYAVYFSTMPSLKGVELALLGYIDPLVSVLVSLFVFGEPMTALQLAGGCMILGFTLLAELTSAKAHS